MTKIDIISGFLGAGKTTLIKQLLKKAISGEKVVLIENEFGEIGIDGGFLKDSGIEIREMNSGCICCSLVGDFGRSLAEVLNKYHPDRVLIEPSGVGKLSDVMKAVKDVASEIEVTLNSAVTVVDAGKCKMYMKNFGEFFNNQIENAGTIVLSRTDIADPKKVKAAVELLRAHNTNAVIVTTPCEELSGEQLLEMLEKRDDMAEALMKEARECAKEQQHHCGEQEHGEEEHAHGDHSDHHDHGESCTCGCHDHEHNHHEHEGHGHEHNHHEHEGHVHDHHHHHADEIFTSWGMENVTGLSREKLEEIMDELAYGTRFGEVLRAKGMIPEKGSGKWLHFDLVPEQVEIREGSPDLTGKICVIGANLDERALKEAFTV